MQDYYAQYYAAYGQYIHPPPPTMPAPNANLRGTETPNKEQQKKQEAPKGQKKEQPKQAQTGNYGVIYPQYQYPPYPGYQYGANYPPYGYMPAGQQHKKEEKKEEQPPPKEQQQGDEVQNVNENELVFNDEEEQEEEQKEKENEVEVVVEGDETAQTVPSEQPSVQLTENEQNNNDEKESQSTQKGAESDPISNWR